MKKIILGLVIINYLSIGLLASASPVDINQHWAKKEILDLSKNGILPYSSNRFRPNDYISRAELVNAINTSFNFTKVSPIAFKDLDPKAWYYNDVRRAVAQGYIVGFDDGSFKPQAPVTREEVAKIIGLALGLEDEIPQSLNYFSDSASIGNWALVYASLLREKSYMLGDEYGAFRPKDLMTRAETAVLLHKIQGQRNLGLNFQEPDGQAWEICLPDLDFQDQTYTVQVGSFTYYQSALDLRDYLLDQGFDSALIRQSPTSSSYLVLAAPSRLSKVQAQELLDNLTSLRIQAFITNKYPEARELPSPNISVTKPGPGQTFSVQAGIFSSLRSAEALKNKLLAQGFTSAQVVSFKSSKNFYVMAGSNLTMAQAKKLNTGLKSKGFESFITSKQLVNINLH